MTYLNQPFFLFLSLMFLMAACQAADQGTSFGQEDKVGFGSQWAVAKDSTTGYLSGGGFQLIYTRSESG